MLITPQADIYDMPPFSMIEGAALEAPDLNGLVMLARVEPDTIARIRRERREAADVRACPCYFAVIGDKVQFEPWPDRKYHVRVRYYPPVREA